MLDKDYKTCPYCAEEINTDNASKEQEKQVELRSIDQHTRIGESAATGAFGGLAAGLASYYLAGGQMIFPIFMIAYILILAGLKGWGKLVGLIVFTAVAALVVVVLQFLQT